MDDIRCTMLESQMSDYPEIKKGDYVKLVGYKTSGKVITKKCLVHSVKSNLSCEVFYNGDLATFSKMGWNYFLYRDFRSLLQNVTISLIV